MHDFPDGVSKVIRAVEQDKCLHFVDSGIQKYGHHFL